MIDLILIKSQLPYVLKGTNFSNLGAKYEGKVRDNYIQGLKRILISTDRLSAFDRIICLIPFKGQVLTQISRFWFEKTKDIFGNHCIEFVDPNVCIARQCRPIPLEMVVRGYITGVTSTSIWHHYERGIRNFCGNVLPDGMKKNQKLAMPIVTPSTKAEKGGHDESISSEEALNRGLVTLDQWEELKRASLALYKRGVEICAKQGIILVDTKYEFGIDESGKIVLIDEMHTPDSSRFWFADSYEELFAAGKEQRKIDKEYVREWLAEKGFRGEGEIPKVPDEVRMETARRYIEAFELITGQNFEVVSGDPLSRIERNLQKYQLVTS